MHIYYGSAGKESVCDAEDTGDVGSIPTWGRSPGEGNGNHSSILVWEMSRTEEPGELGHKSWTQMNH